MTDPDPAGALASSPLQQEEEERATRVDRKCLSERQDLTQSDTELIVNDAKRPEATCLDCGLDYGEFGMDVLLPRWQWLEIHPDDGGLLCAHCIVKRAAKIPGAVGIHAVIGIAPKHGG